MAAIANAGNPVTEMKPTRVNSRVTAALTVLVVACTPSDRAPQDRNEALELRFEETARPDIFRFEGPAERAGASDTRGLWVAVPGLPRPERGEVLNPVTGASVTVALFSREGSDLLLSAEVADALGIATDAQALVSVTALRQEPRLSVP
jgi:hypothetical protein